MPRLSLKMVTLKPLFRLTSQGLLYHRMILRLLTPQILLGPENLKEFV
jgi:hypothetical protein